MSGVGWVERGRRTGCDGLLRLWPEKVQRTRRQTQEQQLISATVPPLQWPSSANTRPSTPVPSLRPPPPPHAPLTPSSSAPPSRILPISSPSTRQLLGWLHAAALRDALEAGTVDPAAPLGELHSSASGGAGGTGGGGAGGGKGGVTRFDRARGYEGQSSREEGRVGQRGGRGWLMVSGLGGM